MEKELSILNIFYIKTSCLPRAFPCLDCHSMRSSCSSQVIILWLHSALLLAGNRWFIQHNIRGRIIINQRRNNKIIIVPQGLWICETLSTVSSSNPISKLLVNYPSPRPEGKRALYQIFYRKNGNIFFRKHKPWRLL